MLCPDAGRMAAYNMQAAQRWDDVRDFIAIHYKFNRASGSEFWRWCNSSITLGSLQGFVDTYEQIGPALASMIPDPAERGVVLLPPWSIFGFAGYLTILLGMRVPSRVSPAIGEEDRRRCDELWTCLRREGEQAHSQSRRRSRRSMKVDSTTRFREWLSGVRTTAGVRAEHPASLWRRPADPRKRSHRRGTSNGGVSPRPSQLSLECAGSTAVEQYLDLLGEPLLSGLRRRWLRVTGLLIRRFRELTEPIVRFFLVLRHGKHSAFDFTHGATPFLTSMG